MFTLDDTNDRKPMENNGHGGIKTQTEEKGTRSSSFAVKWLPLLSPKNHEDMGQITNE